VAGTSKAAELLDLDEALVRLEKRSERQAKGVVFRFFGGMTQEEIAEVLGVSVQTVRLDWRMARAWLSGELEKE
jgi:RNA polymerase sigma factor (sigma-70 family)